MVHRIVIERLFSLGNYQNVKVIAETSEIPDEVWTDVDRLKEVRDALEQEIMASYAQHMVLVTENTQKIRNGQFTEVYQENA